MIKPCKETEIRFYESTYAHPDFTEYIPKFMGTLSLLPDKDSTHAVAAALTQASNTELHNPAPQNLSDAVVVDQAWAPSGGGRITTETAIMLENVAEHYQKPNILDVKLGARLWADDAPLAKREKLDRSAEETTSKALGIRISGMRVWEGSESADQSEALIDGYRVYDKNYGRSFTPDTVRQGFESFFGIAIGDAPSKLIKRVIRRFLEDLNGLQAVLENKESRIYSSSLLFVYEGDNSALQKAFVAEKQLLASSRGDIPTEGIGASGLSLINGHGSLNGDAAYIGDSSSNGNYSVIGASNSHHGSHSHSSSIIHPNDPVLEDEDDGDDENEEITLLPPIQAVKLIDFAHAEWTPGQGPDENLLHGVKSVIRILDGLL